MNLREQQQHAKLTIAAARYLLSGDSAEHGGTTFQPNRASLLHFYGLLSGYHSLLELGQGHPLTDNVGLLKEALIYLRNKLTSEPKEEGTEEAMIVALLIAPYADLKVQLPQIQVGIEPETVSIILHSHGDSLNTLLYHGRPPTFAPMYRKVQHCESPELLVETAINIINGMVR